ncbi:oligosaccharide flippase family protein [uncultured Microbulbifer sp.]|uniref:oligosaccharide flippase family protein n=1 Tax=uncultured Microbulbifer sp. TaxID=348147 RepID=UPI002615DC9A|nr:oligosaccharide flippase family protein [uncultured Microbulbifer sp.]
MTVLSTWCSQEKEFLRTSAVSITARILAALSAVLASVVVGRQLGAAESGYYFLAFSLITVLAAFSRVGLDNAVLRFTGAALVEQAWGVVRSVSHRSILLVACVSSLMALTLHLSAGILANYVFGKPSLEEVLRAMAPGLVGLALLTLVSMSLQGLRRVVASVTTVGILVNLLLALALLLFGIKNAEYAGWAYSAATLSIMFIAYAFFRLGIGDSTGLITWRALFQSCLPLWVTMIMSQLVLWSGQIIAGIWCAPDAVAQLAVAQRTALLTSFILTACNLVIAPRFAAMYKKGQTLEAERLALSSVKLMVLLALPAVTVMLVAPGLVMSLFGDGFRDGAHLLQILVIGQFVNVVTGSVAILLTMSGHERELRNMALISGPIAVTLALALVPVWGETGSAVATAVALATQNLLAAWQVKRLLGFNTLAVWRR